MSLEHVLEIRSGKVPTDSSEKPCSVEWPVIFH